MQRRRLGGLEVGAVGLGCATMTLFYGEPDPDAAVATLLRAPDIGVGGVEQVDLSMTAYL
jgi:aryl-alcohol dehydrogenase-like predicted oxidoreductase